LSVHFLHLNNPLRFDLFVDCLFSCFKLLSIYFLSSAMVYLCFSNIICLHLNHKYVFFSYTFCLNHFQTMLSYGLDLSNKYISSALFLSCQCSCIPPRFYFSIDCLFARSLNVRYKSLSIHFYPYAKVYYHCSNRIKCPITFILWAQPSLIVHALSSIISSSCNVCPVCFGVMDSVLKITNVFKTLVSFIVQVIILRLFQNLQECL